MRVGVPDGAGSYPATSRRGTGFEVVQVTGAPGARGPAPEDPLVRQERGQRHRADADLHRPRPVLPGDEPLDDARDEQRQDQADRHGEQRPRILGQRLSATPGAGRDPGPEDSQARGAGDEDRVQLELAVRGDVEEEGVQLPVLLHQGAGVADVHRVDEQQVRRVHADDAERDGLGGDPGVVGPHRAGERAAAVVRVVLHEVVLDVLSPFGVAAEHRGQHLRMLDRPDRVEQADDQRGDRDREAQPADAIQRGGQLRAEERGQPAQHVRARRR